MHLLSVESIIHSCVNIVPCNRMSFVKVTVVDNFFTGRKRNVDTWLEEQSTKLCLFYDFCYLFRFGHENFELINHDVVEPLLIEGNNTMC